jgi:sugar lactone lactonase YvrE
MRTRLVLLLTAALLATAAPAIAPARQATGPEVLPLPNGWQPEGIASGPGRTLFVGSIPTGAVWRMDARTGQGRELVPAHSGRAAIGLKHSRGLLFVAGGPTGHAYVYDARTGADVADVALTAAPTFLNDVAVTPRAAWFTDSQRQRLYRLDRDRRGRPAARGVTVPITGDLRYDDDAQTFEANGIAAARGGRTLLVVQTRTGGLFAVDAAGGASRRVPLAGGDLANADGILLRGRTLYVVQNQLNRIAVVRLNRRLSRGRIVRRITHDAFDVPTTLARKGGQLFAVNARFSTTPGPDTPYSVVGVPATGAARHHR